MRSKGKIFISISFVALLLCGLGCGGFAARRIAEAPNSYPTWLAPEAPVELGFSPKLLTNFPSEYLQVGPPQARLRYRVIRPADYQFHWTSTNWVSGGKKKFEFKFKANVPGKTNQWSGNPRGTLVLLHGYGVGGFSMLPWALSMSEKGWETVLVDLRGHGKSTGKRIYFGVREWQDLGQLIDVLKVRGELRGDVSVLGDSYGAALALRWAGKDPRVKHVVAMSPYANLDDAVMNIAKQYANWVPKVLLRAGLKKLPGVLGTEQAKLDMTSVLKEYPVKALFVAGAEDETVPLPVVEKLYNISGAGSSLLVVPDAPHEALPYYFDVLLEPVAEWLAAGTKHAGTAQASDSEPRMRDPVLSVQP